MTVSPVFFVENQTIPIRVTNSAIPYLPPFTIAMSIKINSLASWILLYSKEGSVSAEIAPVPHKDGKDGLFCLELKGITDVYSTIRLQKDVLTHLAIVYSGTTIKFYENGILKTIRTQTTPPQVPSGVHEPQAMNGTIYYCRVWNVALTDEEVKTDFTGIVPDPQDVDTIAPVITVLGANPITVPVGSIYNDPGATATDNKDPTVTVITYTGAVNTAHPGTYTVTYNATDLAGNKALTKTRTVLVVESLDTQPPVITLIGGTPIELPLGTEYIEPGATAVGAYGESVPVDISGTVDIHTVGTYPIIYTATDTRGNIDSIRRFVNVVAATPPPPPPPVPVTEFYQLIKHICEDIIEYIDSKQQT